VLPSWEAALPPYGLVVTGLPPGRSTAPLIHDSGGGSYLETAATVTTFLLAPRVYEAHRRITSQAMRDLAAAAAREVCLLGPDGTERPVPASQLRSGDRFVVRPGETIAGDGEVEFGQDRHRPLHDDTGESAPGEADEGDTVIGGTIMLTGRPVVRAVSVDPDTQLSRLIRLVEDAQAEKAAIQRLADRISGAFVPAILACAAATLAGWLLAGSPASTAFSAGSPC
jgi:Cu+-exporting ATPase